jgi:hypothetical protein
VIRLFVVASMIIIASCADKGENHPKHSNELDDFLSEIEEARNDIEQRIVDENRQRSEHYDTLKYNRRTDNKNPTPISY